PSLQLCTLPLVAGLSASPISWDSARDDSPRVRIESRWRWGFLASGAIYAWAPAAARNQQPRREREGAADGQADGQQLTSVCWDKCITGTPGSKFSAGETACLSNCARRFLDMSMILGKRFQLH
ncbi:unnamed protein product, partial [Urochloa humidicola]